MALAFCDSIGGFSIVTAYPLGSNLLFGLIFTLYSYMARLLTRSTYVSSNVQVGTTAYFPPTPRYASCIMQSKSHLIQAYVPSYLSLSVDNLQSLRYVYLSSRLSSKLEGPWLLSL